MSDFLIVFGAEYFVYLAALGLGAYWFYSRYTNARELAIVTLLVLPVAWALARLAGMLISHEQPFAAGGFEPLLPHEVDNSFPSDHAALVGALAGVATLYNRALGILLWMLALGTGVARILAGLHYPQDVVAGLLIGLISAVAVYWCVHLYFSTRSHT